MLENKTNNFRDDFPGYMGYIPYKKEVIGMTVGSTNSFIKKTLTTEPPQEEIMRPVKYDDYTHYNKDYFNENFYRDYKLEEDLIHSNKSREADTWINGSKYKIYPQHIPGYKAHVPGIYASNIHGLGYSKLTAIAIKGDYPKTADLAIEDRYKTSHVLDFKKPIGRDNIMANTYTSGVASLDPAKMKVDSNVVYKSKIANVPTPGYSGHTSIFIKPISYLRDKNKEEEEKTVSPQDDDNQFSYLLNQEKGNPNELPYIVGYKGHRPGVRAKNHFGNNFREVSFNTRKFK